MIEPQLSDNSKQLYIVAPPGSGKTILGLYVWADMVRQPALVAVSQLCHSSTVARTSLFDLDGREDQLSLDPRRLQACSPP